MRSRCGCLSRFQSTPSGGKATSCDARHCGLLRVSIHAFRGEGDAGGVWRSAHRQTVSIHAFRGEGDVCWVWSGTDFVTFQSTPSGGKATPRGGAQGNWTVFQSTPSGGKATPQSTPMPHHHRVFQSTPSGGKATQSCARVGRARRVSIHAFRGEGDDPPAVIANPPAVSIHAFRGEGDPSTALWQPTTSSFNPRLPGGRRRVLPRAG